MNLNLAFAQSDSTGILYMAPGSTIQMNGGTLSVNKDQNLTTGRIEFANIDVVNSPSFGLTYTGTSELKFSRLDFRFKYARWKWCSSVYFR